jgi:polyferredoxin
MSNPKQNVDEPKRWLDEPRNVRKIIRGFYWLCGLVVVADLVFTVGWHKHAAFAEEFSLRSLETLPAFYGIYGFLACVALVYVSKLMRDWNGKRTLMRDEDYWDK